MSEAESGTPNEQMCGANVVLRNAVFWFFPAVPVALLVTAAPGWLESEVIRLQVASCFVNPWVGGVFVATGLLLHACVFHSAGGPRGLPPVWIMCIVAAANVFLGSFIFESHELRHGWSRRGVSAWIGVASANVLISVFASLFPIVLGMSSKRRTALVKLLMFWWGYLIAAECRIMSLGGIAVQ